ncbi:MAG TPA: hypothetical protein VI756_01550 [Blastocatellia bacterium]
MIHSLPAVRTQRHGFEELALLGAAARNLYADRLELDMSRCEFFEANMTAPLASVLAGITDRLNSVDVVNVPKKVEAILRKNQFLLNYGFNPIQDTNRTSLPFRRIKLTDEGRFADYLRQYLGGKGMPRMTPELERVFTQSVFEVFQNAVVHSGSRLGVFVCGQFYPQMKRLDITLADSGRGIRTNVREYLGRQISSVEAIRWALREGNTTKRGPQPGGVGLKFLKDFVIKNRGKIQIASRLGFYELRGSDETFAKLSSDFPGTAVNIEVNTADTKSYALSSGISVDDIF